VIVRPPVDEEKKPKKRARKITPRVIEARKQRREEIVRPLLNDKKWSDRQWVIEAGKAGGREIDTGVVYDYLAGKSFPQPRNAMRLAKVIGLAKLPR
jgi:hypothetical protein